MIIGKILLTLLFLCVGQYLSSETDIDNDDTVRTLRIAISGNDTIKDSRIRSLMETDTKGLFDKILFWRKPPPFFTGELDADLIRVERFYQRQGFLNVEIQSDVSIIDDKAEVKIYVLENDRVRISEIDYTLQDVSGQERMEHLEIVDEISNQAQLQAGTYFVDDLFKSDQRMMQDYYDLNGYPFVTIAHQLELLEDERFVDVMILITPGKRAFIGQINFEGLNRTDQKLLDRLIAFSEGDKYDRRKLERSRNNLQSTELFSLVSVGMSLDQEKEFVPVEIYVREKDNITMSFGVGYGLEDRLRLYTEIAKMRFLGGLRSGSVFLKHSYLEPIHIDLKVKQPVFPTIKSSIIINPFYRQEEEPAYSLERLGFNTTLNHRLSSNSVSFLTYSFEDNNLKSGTDEADLLIYENLIPSEEMMHLSTPVTEEEGSYRKSTISIGFLRDSARPDFYPNRGSVFSTIFSYSGLGFNADFDYLRVLNDLRYYQDLGSAVVLAARVKGGVIEPLYDNDFIPYEERFYAGGAFSVRGWSRANLGPKNSEGDPIGGKSYIEGSVELRYPLWNDLSLVNFIDGGNVWEKRLAHSLTDLRYASGLGIRYATPIGPIRLDIGMPIFDDDKDIQFFLSIGQAF